MSKISKYLTVNILIITLLLIIQGNMGAQEITDKSNEGKINPNFHPTLAWAGLQLIPSPQWVKSNNSTDFGFRWQITPILYSWGINKNVSPWRYVVVDPVARQSGSIELFFSPEVIFSKLEFKDSWTFRSGARTYFPLWHKGEYLSGSLAVSYFNFNGDNGISYEAGFYLLAGILGFQTTYSPNMKNSEWIFTIRLRYF